MSKKWNGTKLSKKLLEFEDGIISEEDEISLFQHLVDTGLAWKFQGYYGRYAEKMIHAGLIKEKK